MIFAIEISDEEVEKVFTVDRRVHRQRLWKNISSNLCLPGQRIPDKQEK